jgi:hypothetical protein
MERKRENKTVECVNMEKNKHNCALLEECVPVRHKVGRDGGAFG